MLESTLGLDLLATRSSAQREPGRYVQAIW
jgi:hypothetical protein